MSWHFFWEKVSLNWGKKGILDLRLDLKKKSLVYSCWARIIKKTRSYATLRAADLDWIVGPEYSLGGHIFWDSQLLRRRSL